jgi:predicted phosphatase
MRKFIGQYNDLVTAYEADKKGFECSRFGDLDSAMSVNRNTGFTEGLGSRSTQNLAYRALRRLNVSIPDMVDVLEDECTFVAESIG